MKLRKLHEVSLWKKLNDTDFKNKAIDFILEQQQIINDLIKTTTDLKEEIYGLPGEVPESFMWTTERQCLNI